MEQIQFSDVIVLVNLAFIAWLIYRIKNFINNRSYSRRDLRTHAIFTYISYLNNYKVRTMKHDDKGREAIMRMLFKCIIDTTKKNLRDLVDILTEHKLRDIKKEELYRRINETFGNVLHDYRLLFTEKASKYMDKEDIELILETFRVQNEYHIKALSKILLDITNSEVYDKNAEIVNCVLDAALNSLVQISLSIKSTIQTINGRLSGKTFDGRKIQ